MKKKQQLLGIVFLIYSIVFPLFQTYEVLANTTDTTKTSLLQTDKVAVAYSLNEVSNQQNLNLSISYDTKSATTKDKVKFRFTTADNQILSFEQKSGWIKDTSNNTEWYVQDQFKQTTNETLTLPLPTSINQLKIEIQLDEETTENTPATVKNNILEVKQQGPYTITIPTVTATSSSQATTPSTTSSQALTSSTTVSSTTSDPATTSSKANSQTTTPSTTTSSTTTSTTKSSETSKTTTAAESTTSTTQASTPAIAARTFMAAETQSASDINTDYYIQDDQGIYPKNGTNKYLGSKLSDSIKNANYGSDFDTGYQEVTNANGTKTLFKKTIAPTGNDGEFSVQLDMLGQTLTTKPKLDVVIVLDKSGSMGYSSYYTTTAKWNKIISSVTNFTNSFLDESNSNNRLSILSFQSRNALPTVDIAKFTNSYFTNKKSDITNSNILQKIPGNDGTPTFIGVDAGLEVLKSEGRTDATKIIITVTDGFPTQFPNPNNYKTTTYQNNRTLVGPRELQSNYKVGNYQYSTTNIESYKISNNYYYNGNGFVDQEDNPYNLNTGLQETINYLNTKLKGSPYVDYSRFAIEIGNQNSDTFMKLLGKDGVFRSDDNNISSLLAKINKKVNTYDSLNDGSFEDPISDSFEYVSNSFTQKTISRTSDLKVTEGANSTNFSLANNKITATNLTLSSTDPNKFMGYRLTYKLKIKDGFKDGRFQQANGQTTLRDSADTIAADYIVPSARYQTRTITASSVDGNKAAVNGATYVLERKKADGTWEVIETKTASSSTNTVTFTTVAARDTSGNIFTYRVTQNKVGNYAMPEKQTVIQPKDWLSDKQNLTFENPALKAEIAFTKVNELQTPMAGVSFTLSGNGITAITKETDKDGKISFGSYPVGKYTLKETKTNAGYQLPAEKTIEIVEENGTAKAKLEGQSLAKIQNTLLATNLVFETFDYNDKKTPLDGKYTVTEKDSGGKTVTDLSNLMPGRYQFNQTQTSTAYQLLKDTIYFELTKDGQIREIDQSSNPVTTKNSQVTFTYTLATDGKTKNQLKVTVLNLKKGQLPETGGFGHFFTNRLAVIFASLGLLVALLYVGLQVRGRKR
ncbi:VWA domain-containing protein [uncultured Enterococcus sp.]|uniref:VWA domain-containing protein n=1 Tax=uncultured Enterococcus sp. TaxID=167972 RepID=UPI0025D914CD|nr:VWA domain-containing protein [uncultured Enterococcus sp.]